MQYEKENCLLMLQRYDGFWLNPKNCEEYSLSFKVQGFKFKGSVEVVYNEGRDLFDLSFIKRNKVVKSIDGVFFDSLVEVIDDYVEKTTDYEKRVAAEYSISL